jgi:hypothetical protein
MSEAAGANRRVDAEFRMPADRNLSNRTDGRLPKASQEGTRGGWVSSLASMEICWGSVLGRAALGGVIGDGSPILDFFENLLMSWVNRLMLTRMVRWCPLGIGRADVPRIGALCVRRSREAGSSRPAGRRGYVWLRVLDADDDPASQIFHQRERVTRNRIRRRAQVRIMESGIKRGPSPNVTCCLGNGFCGSHILLPGIAERLSSSLNALARNAAVSR